MRNSALVFALTVCAFAASPSRAGEESIRLKEGVGRDVTMARCAVCHSLDYITMVAPVMNRAAWETSVRKMIDVFGAPVGEQDVSSIVEYLGQHYSATAK
ncbi:cytochrome c [Steroidobacter cummioxidans]|uniref:cytochrome c n=1 Tax=Steroidobacter cummioxidans TaxID=1803913 RepID=UPI000E324404|nr:cytochrome c [Steroidobacter cummioxidans]